MDIKQLECFVNLAETLNFSSTAQHLFLSQPTVSKQIKQLEQEIGFALFKRTKRDVELTQAGASFYKDMKDILAKVHQGIAKAKGFATKYDSNYTIAYENNYLTIRFLASIIESFTKKHPHILIELKMTDFRRKNYLFIEKKIDFLFTVKDNLSTLPGTCYQELYIAKFVCIVAKSYELASHKCITLKELNHNTLILLNPVECPKEMIQIEEMILENCPQSSTLYTDNALSGCTMAKCGLGIAVMPDFICIADPELCIIPLAVEDTVSYGVAWHDTDKRRLTSSLVTTAQEIYRDKKLFLFPE